MKNQKKESTKPAETAEKPVDPSTEKFQSRISKDKRMALLRYLEILFLVAFALVAVSLFLQMRSTNSTLSDYRSKSESFLAKAEELQAQNRELQDKNIQLTKELEEEKAKSEDLNIAYSALANVLASPYTDLTVEHSKELETVENYKDTYTEDAWALFEAYLTHVGADTNGGETGD